MGAIQKDLDSCINHCIPDKNPSSKLRLCSNDVSPKRLLVHSDNRTLMGPFKGALDMPSYTCITGDYSLGARGGSLYVKEN